jgi:hypothetical protein
MRFSDWLFAREGRHHEISLSHLIERVFVWLTQERGRPAETVAAALCRDAVRSGQAELPAMVKEHLPAGAAAPVPREKAALGRTVRRQARHRTE